MSTDLNAIADQLSTLTVMEAAELATLLEEKWGVSAAAPVAVAAAAPGAGAAPVEEQTEFDAVLISFGDKKIQVIKAVREAIGPDLPIVYRISQWKLQDYDGKLAETPEELGPICGALAEAGVDIFDVSTRVFSRPAFAGSDMGLAGWIRKLTGLPTMTVGVARRLMALPASWLRAITSSGPPWVTPCSRRSALTPVSTAMSRNIEVGSSDWAQSRWVSNRRS